MGFLAKFHKIIPIKKMKINSEFLCPCRRYSIYLSSPKIKKRNIWGIFFTFINLIKLPFYLHLSMIPESFLQVLLIPFRIGYKIQN